MGLENTDGQAGQRITCRTILGLGCIDIFAAIAAVATSRLSLAILPCGNGLHASKNSSCGGDCLFCKR